ncbi:MAG: hypothetical protein ACP5M0_02700 [Desulfomonilaceae bacterium]
MLNRKGLNDTRQDQPPTQDYPEGSGTHKAHPLGDGLDYGLMDDLSSGRDSFFEGNGPACKPAESHGAKRPGFADPCPDEDSDISRPCTGQERASGDCVRDRLPRESVAQSPMVESARRASATAAPGLEPKSGAGQPPRPDSSIYVRDDEPPRAFQGRERPSEAPQFAPSSAVPPRAHAGRPAMQESSQRTPEVEPAISPDEFSGVKKADKEQSSWSRLKDHSFISRSGRILSDILAGSRDFVKTRRRTVVPAIAAALLLLAFLYLAQPKPYSVETRLMFISGDGRMPDPQGWSLDKETKYFNNTNVVYTLAQKLFEGQGGPSAAGRPQDQENPAAPHRKRRIISDGRDRFKNPGEFIKWFVKASSLETDSSSVPARITLKLTGKDPKFLKTVSENYVRSYVEFRRTVPTPAVMQASASNPPDHAAAPPALKTINERLQTFDIQEREYELALNLIDSGKSHFAGFIPKESMVEANSLAHFQQKIVQLELTKNSLSLKYAPESRELRTVEAEIQAARKAMRQCLVEQLRFVKHNKELLLTQKMELEKGLVAPAEAKPQTPQAPQPAPVKQAVSADGPVPLGNGLYLIWDAPSLKEKPLLSKVGDAAGRLASGVQQSIDSVRDAKDSLITGLYKTLVSDSARGEESEGEEESPKPAGRYIVRQ